MIIRGFREEERFKRQLELLGIDLAHWDEVFSGLEFILARTPEQFHKIKPESRIRVATVQCYRDLPEIHVLFAYDDNLVCLLDIFLGGSTDDGD